MEEYEYKGFTLYEDEFGCFWLDDPASGTKYEFESYDNACDWIDMTLAAEAPTEPKQLHTYQVFYIDDATDQGFEAHVTAYSLDEALRKVYEEYDVYQIVDYDILD